MANMQVHKKIKIILNKKQNYISKNKGGLINQVHNTVVGSFEI